MTGTMTNKEFRRETIIGNDRSIKRGVQHCSTNVWRYKTNIVDPTKSVRQKEHKAYLKGNTKINFVKSILKKNKAKVNLLYYYYPLFQLLHTNLHLLIK